MLGTVDLLPHAQVVTNNIPANSSSADPLQSGDVSSVMPQLATEPVPMKTEAVPAPPPPRLEEEDDEDEQDPIASLEQDSNDFQRATISIVMTLLPTDHHPDGRLTLIGVRSHNLPPQLTTARFNDLLPLPESLSQALTRWEQTFPAALTARKTQRDERAAMQQTTSLEQEKKREAERQARKSKVAKPPAAKATSVAPTHKPDREQHSHDSHSNTALPQAGLFE